MTFTDDPRLPAGGAPPPGWYPDPTGVVRWWDGGQWTAQTQGPPAGPNNTLAMVAHLGGLIGGWITPLIVYLIDGGKDRWVRHNAAEALNFQLTVQLVSLVMMVPFFALFWLPLVTTSSSSAGPAVGAFFGGFLLFFVVVMAVSVLNIVWSIMGMIRANKHEYWRYPVRIRFVRGSLSPSELF